MPRGTWRQGRGWVARLQGRVAQRVAQGARVADGVVRGQLRDDHVEYAGGLARVQANTAGVVHHHHAEDERYCELGAAGPSNHPHCSRQP